MKRQLAVNGVIQAPRLAQTSRKLVRRVTARRVRRHNFDNDIEEGAGNHNSVMDKENNNGERQNREKI